ncbi:hypothetical protein [Streptomyces malaysiense]|uniref:Aminotransferase class I/classII domain-containing protein n=1 Tax=Streptomyces malaysiense TaxID=1428626 RepID=A0A1J4Q1J9_9ACTN|nr:hypothetical protein [Streptomyces malaysiense]OIK26882.1 hypothetical protein VT52_014435 [Streptomyces malaysiense]
MIDLSGSPAPWPDEATRLWADRVGRAARQTDLWTVPAPQGDEVLRETLAGQLGLPAEQLTITASLRATALTYARRFGHVVLERPGYPGVVPVLASAGAQVTRASWDELLKGGFGGDPRDTVLWLTSPGRNPDGRTLTGQERDRVTELAAEGHRVVVNETYAWFCGHAGTPAGADSAGTLHKLRGVGARLGWMAGPGCFEEAFPELLGTPPSPVWQRAWGLFLRDGGLDLLRNGPLAGVEAAKDAFRERLATAHGIEFPAFDGPNALIPLDPRAGEAPAPTAEQLEESALEAFHEEGFKAVAARHFEAGLPALRATFFGVGAAGAVRFADAVARSPRTALRLRCQGHT